MALSHDATCCEWAASFCDTPPPAAQEKERLKVHSAIHNPDMEPWSLAAVKSSWARTDAPRNPMPLEEASDPRTPTSFPPDWMRKGFYFGNHLAMTYCKQWAKYVLCRIKCMSLHTLV